MYNYGEFPINRLLDDSTLYPKELPQCSMCWCWNKTQNPSGVCDICKDEVIGPNLQTIREEAYMRGEADAKQYMRRCLEVLHD